MVKLVTVSDNWIDELTRRVNHVLNKESELGYRLKSKEVFRRDDLESPSNETWTCFLWLEMSE